MSHGHVLAPRFRTEEGACGILVRLTCKLGQRLRRNGYFARSLGLSVNNERGGGFFETIELPCVNDTPTLLRQFHKLWQRRSPGSSPVKKVGVTVSGLVLVSHVPRLLFDEDERRQRASQVVDQINERCGSLAIYFGPVHDYRLPMENKIAFGRIPEDSD
jgi:DNA polymerase-4